MTDFPTRPLSERDFPHGFYVVWAGLDRDFVELRDQFPPDVRNQLHFVDPEHSADVVEQVQATSPLSLEAPAKTVDFGSVYRGGTTGAKVLRISATKAAAVQLSLAGGVGNGFRLSGVKQPILLQPGDNDLSLTIDTDRSASAGIHDGFLEVRSAEEHTQPLLVFNVRVMASRFWFPPFWAWVACGLLFLISATLFVAARTQRKPRVNTVERPSRPRPVSVAPVTNPRLALLAAKRAALNELRVSIRQSKERIVELERRCALLEREIFDLTSELTD
jgi:hypothetical protein